MSEIPSLQSSGANGQAAEAVLASKPVRLGSFEDLLLAVQELLRDPRLDASVVTPLIYSLLETFIDDSHQYPFDEVNNLLASLELEAYPEHGLRELIGRIEEAYGQNHIAIRDSHDELVVDDEFEGLRQSIRYAAMVAEQDYQRGTGDDGGDSWLPLQAPVRRDR